MRRTAIVATVGILLVLLTLDKAHADRLRIGGAALAPMSHTKFCIAYPHECASTLHNEAVATRLPVRDLRAVNAKVNIGIKPVRNEGGLQTEHWELWPAANDCGSFAVTKRHELLARGWPSRVLLLAEVVVLWGEHHLVLVVRMQNEDLVLDNLREQVLPWEATGYRWVRIESPLNPSYWQKVEP